MLETISSQFRKELLGLRGFFTTSFKKMRLFYENWSFFAIMFSIVNIYAVIINLIKYYGILEILEQKRRKLPNLNNFFIEIANKS